MQGQVSRDTILHYYSEDEFRGEIAPKGYSSSNESVAAVEYKRLPVNEWESESFIYVVPKAVGTTTVTVTSTEGDVVTLDYVVEDVSDEVLDYRDPVAVRAIALQHTYPAQLELKNSAGATASFSAPDAETYIKLYYLDLMAMTVEGKDAERVALLVSDAVDASEVLCSCDLHLEDSEGSLAEMPDGASATVTLPLPKGASSDGLRVYHVAEDGTVTDMKATVDASKGTVSFVITHFSTFALVELSEQPVTMLRLYNQYTGEHLYTADGGEKDLLVGLGWTYEGEAWTAPATGEPVYRLFNPFADDHHFTMKAEERDALVELGWKDEGVAWRSADAEDEGAQPLYRLFNPFETTATHLYTANKGEYDKLGTIGWQQEGVAWYGIASER